MPKLLNMSDPKWYQLRAMSFISLCAAKVSDSETSESPMVAIKADRAARESDPDAFLNGSRPSMCLFCHHDGVRIPASGRRSLVSWRLVAHPDAVHNLHSW